MSMSMTMEKHSALTAQCPLLPAVAEADALKLPIHAERSGTSGPLVVIIHGGVQGGIGGGPATFARQKALAGLGWQAALVDRPRFGQSPSRGVDDMVADAAWIAGMLGDGAHLIGHSWSGAAALLAAGRRPEAVRSLVLVEPALQGLAMTDPEFEANFALTRRSRRRCHRGARTRRRCSKGPHTSRPPRACRARSGSRIGWTACA